jgi:hypothetical protein
MTNIETIEVTGLDGIATEYVIIDHGNEQFTSMPKSEYDRRQAEQSTPIVIDETSTK